MPPLTPMQMRILEYLQNSPGWHDRHEMIDHGVGDNAYSVALGSISDPSPDSLIGRGLIEYRRESGLEAIEYRILSVQPKQ